MHKVFCRNPFNLAKYKAWISMPIFQYRKAIVLALILYHLLVFILYIVYLVHLLTLFQIQINSNFLGGTNICTIQYINSYQYNAY
jgi:hypothetical protein